MIQFDYSNIFQMGWSNQELENDDFFPSIFHANPKYMWLKLEDVGDEFSQEMRIKRISFFENHGKTASSIYTPGSTKIAGWKMDPD